MRMTHEQKEDAKRLMSYDAGVAKSRLMDVMYQLEELGAVREAKSLGTIIGKLESWQHANGRFI